uniref:TRP C-terminal domain-containing protein n=1 Tax=Florenciella parvula TaxID=236787 RepID=A0A7S2BT64_9STRA
MAVDYSIERGTLEARALILYAIIMIFVYAIGIPTLYVVLLYRAQGELSLHKPIKLDPAKLVCSAKERAELKAAVMEFYFGDVTLGYGITDKTFKMLRSTDETAEFRHWLEASNMPHPKSATLLPLLEAYITSQEEKWEDVSQRHPLSFLLGSWEQRVYWWEVFEVIRRLLLSGVLVLFGPGSAIQAGMSILICVFSIKAYSLYAPFREDADDYLQEVTQWQLFMVLFAVILSRMNTSDDSAQDTMYLGWLLVFVVVPGYVAMAWECVKSYLDVFYEAVDEAKKTKDDVKACGACLRGGGGAAGAAKKGQKKGQRRRSSAAQLQGLLDEGVVEVELMTAGEDTPQSGIEAEVELDFEPERALQRQRSTAGEFVALFSEDMAVLIDGGDGDEAQASYMDRSLVPVPSMWDVTAVEVLSADQHTI